MSALQRRSWVRRLTVAALGATLITAPALAQTPTGTILGGVKDAQGAAVPGATVTATNLGTQFSRSAVSDEAGEYILRLLPIGNYQVEVSIPGFKNFTPTSRAHSSQFSGTLALGQWAAASSLKRLQ